MLGAGRGCPGRVLFWLGVSLAGLLVALVLLAPLVPLEEEGGWTRVLALFAQDPSLRRTCLASAAGLVVTACVFFRPPHRSHGGRRYRQQTTRPRTPWSAGA